MKVTKVIPRGACHGVVTAIQMVTDAAQDPNTPRPIYILGMIVHNKYYTDAFNALGVITLDSKNKTRLELLDEIDHGTVIMTAHGVSPQVIQKAKAKGLNIIDATCIDVTSTHTLIHEKVNEGYQFIYIGKKGHPEPEGAIGVAPEFVHLIDSTDDIDNLTLDTEKIIITNQTTLSMWDVAKLANYLKEKYPTAIYHREICNATQVRQEAVAALKDCDLLIVVGDKMSNNTLKLASVSEEIAHIPSMRITDILDINPQYFIDNNIQHIAITSGASTPTRVTTQIVKYLEKFDFNDESTWELPKPLNPVSILPRSQK